MVRGDDVAMNLNEFLFRLVQSIEYWGPILFFGATAVYLWRNGVFSIFGFKISRRTHPGFTWAFFSFCCLVVVLGILLLLSPRSRNTPVLPKPAKGEAVAPR